MSRSAFICYILLQRSLNAHLSEIQGQTYAGKMKNMSLSAARNIDPIWPEYVQLYCTVPTELDTPAVDLEGEDKVVL